MTDFKDYINIDVYSNYRELLQFNKTNKNGEKMLLEVSHCSGYGTKSLPYIWFRNGYTDKEINKYLFIKTYVDLPDGSCQGLYNPQIPDCQLIDFDWHFADNKKNRQKLINEVARRFYGE